MVRAVERGWLVGVLAALTVRSVASTTFQNQSRVDTRTARSVDGIVDQLHDSNMALRLEYLEVEAQIAEAPDAELDQLAQQLADIGERFVSANTGLAGVLWRKFLPQARSSDTEDFMLSALEALWKSFLSWDPAQGSFGTWSRRHISGALRREVNFYERPHRRYHEDLLVRKAEKLKVKLTAERGLAPSEEELAGELGVSVDKLRSAHRGRSMSLDHPDFAEPAVSHHEAPDIDAFHEPDTDPSAVLAALANSDAEPELALQILTRATSELDAQELYVTLVRAGLHGWEPESIQEVATTLGVGREILRRRANKAMETVNAAVDGLGAA